VQPSSQPKILMIGNDPSLSYLIGRYVEQSGYGITRMQLAPTVAETRALRPTAILFQSVETLETSQARMKELAECDVPVLVCSSVTDEARARELGADRCLLHPLTYDSVLAALAGTTRQSSP